jgi:ankyrin repeat protein
MTESQDSDNEAVQFLYACIRGDKATLLTHLQSKTRGDINICRQDGWTAVHYACSAGKKDIVEVLALWYD